MALTVATVASGCAQKEATLEFPDDSNVSVINVGNDGVKAGLASDVPEVSGKTTTITVEVIGRADPFVPDASEEGGYYISSDLITPPDDLSANTKYGRTGK